MSGLGDGTDLVDDTVVMPDESGVDGDGVLHGSRFLLRRLGRCFRFGSLFLFSAHEDEGALGGSAQGTYPIIGEVIEFHFLDILVVNLAAYRALIFCHVSWYEIGL